jgi:translation initiation factor 5
MSGGMVNIGGDSRDMNYRYRMPVLVTKVEGRGNGIKTVIVNMVDIAKALHIHPAYPTKFFGIELGAQSKFNVSTERAIVNGCHQAADLAKILDRFIQQFILCPNCKLPELKMGVKSTSIKIECAACGHASQIKSAHRLVGYMTKNPPKSFTADSKGDKDDEKDGKKKDRKKKEKGNGDDELDEAGASVVAAASAGGSNIDDEIDGAAETKKKDKADETPEERAARKAAKKAKKEKKEKKEKVRLIRHLQYALPCLQSIIPLCMY